MTIKLGQAANLVAGFDPSWNPGERRLNVLRPVSTPPMNPVLVRPLAERGRWSAYPTITLHDDALSLLDALVPYRVVAPASFSDAPRIGAGALLAGMPGGKAALAALSTTLGVKLDDPQIAGFALVTLTRKDGIVEHASSTGGVLLHVRPRQPDPEFGLTEEFTRNSVRLRHAGHSEQQDYGEALDKDKANEFLRHIAEHGTHYVSAVTLGDTIMQVFAYRADRWTEIKEAYKDPDDPEAALSGPGARLFAQFTTVRTDGAFGYVEQFGHILCLSHSQTFRDSIAAGKWHDPRWSRRNSVFALYQGTALSVADLNRTFRDQVTAGVTLASLCVMIETKRALLWRRLFKGAMAQKYRSTIDPNFSIIDDRDFRTLLPEDQANVASSIATPKINVYKAKLDLAKMQFVSAKDVKALTTFGYVLESAGDTKIDLPGRDIRLFAQVIDARRKGQPREIEVEDEAFDGLRIGCGEFLGALAVRSRSGKRHSVILDGLRFDLPGDDPTAMPVVQADVRLPPRPDDLADLADSLQFSLAFAEGVLGDPASSVAPLQDLVRRHLGWVADALKPAATSDNKDLLALRVRALDLARFRTDPNAGAFVPLLPYQDYEDHVKTIAGYLRDVESAIIDHEKQLADRRKQEAAQQTAEAINQNIINTGGLLVNLITANADQQKKLEEFYDILIARQQSEIARQKACLDDLSKDLFEARGGTRQKVNEYKAAVQNWETEENIKFVLEIAGSLFDAAKPPKDSEPKVSETKALGMAAQALGAAAEAIQKMLNAYNTVSNVHETAAAITEGLANAQAALDALPDGNFGSGATVPWDKMALNFEEVMALGPDLDAKSELQRAFKRLLQSGKAVADAQSTLHGLRREVYTHLLHKELAKDHAKRLEALKGKFTPAQVAKPDRSGIDLMALTGQLAYNRNRMLTILAKSFLNLDLALRYAHLQPPTTLSSFSVMELGRALIEQKGKTIEAKELLNKYPWGETKAISVEVPVDPKALADGKAYRIVIHADNAAFDRYVTARVKKVVVSVDGVEKTDQGLYLVKLAFPGESFTDRDLRRDPWHFRTPLRERVYDYKVAGNEPQFTDSGVSWSDQVSPVTPLGAWDISFPKTKTNRGLAFRDGPVTLRLTFVLQARIVDPALARRLRSLDAIDQQIEVLTQALDEPAAESYALTRPTEDELVRNLNGRSCTNGWDVVFNMEMQEINKSLEHQWKNSQNAIKPPPFVWAPDPIEEEDPEGNPFFKHTKFTCQFSTPRLQFTKTPPNSTPGLPAPPSMTVELELPIESGTRQTGTQRPGAAINWRPPQSVTGNLKAHSARDTLAAVVEGTNKLAVRLDLRKGTFSTAQIGITGGSVAFNEALKSYFTENDIKLIINELDIGTIPVLEAMRPNSFEFKFLQTRSGTEILQLFIRTAGRMEPNSTQASLTEVDEPLPLDRSASLFVRAGLVFGDVLPKSLTNPGWTLKGVAEVSGNHHKPWKAECETGHVLARVDLSSLDRVERGTVSGHQYETDYRYSIEGSNPMQWSVKGMTIVPQADGRMKVSVDGKQEMRYLERRTTRYFPPVQGLPETPRTSTYKSELKVETSSALQASIGGSGQEQTVEFSTTSAGVDVSGHLSGGGPCGSDNLQAELNRKLKEQIPEQIKNGLQLNFRAVSVFVLKNLLFNNGNNYIDLKSCYIPGDLVMFGKFIQRTP